MSVKELPTPEEMQAMAEVDLKNIDTSNLIDIEQVKIRTELPQEERIADYIHQIKNPYCYISHGVAVKISFTGKCTLEESLSRCIYIIEERKKQVRKKFGKE